MALIEMNKLIASIKSYAVGEQGDYLDGVADAIYCVTHAPIVDAVPVVRCEDCRYRNLPLCPIGEGTLDIDFCSYGTHTVEVVRCCECKHHRHIPGTNSMLCNKIPRLVMMADAYCSYGERKEEGET